MHLPIYVQERFARASRNGAYGAAVETIDWVTAVLLHELRVARPRRATIVVFTSDNGSRGRDGGSNAPLRGAKGTTWEGGMRVPCIVRWPGHIAPGRTSDELATSIDLFPTLAALCGADAAGGPDHRRRRHLARCCSTTGATSPHDAFCYYWMNDLEAVRAGRWKLHVAKHGAPVTELYDLVADPARRPTAPPSTRRGRAALEAIAEAARRSLGDARLGIAGADVRPIGRVADPVPLTTYDPAHPYYAAEYDLPDRG